MLSIAPLPKVKKEASCVIEEYIPKINPANTGKKIIQEIHDGSYKLGDVGTFSLRGKPQNLLEHRPCSQLESACHYR